MDCNEVEGQIVPYLLGALEPGEMSRIDYHVDSCPDCTSKMRQEGGVIADLAYAVPQFEVPSDVKQRLFASIDAGGARQLPPLRARAWLRILPDLSRQLVANSGMAAASMLVVVMILGGVWFNGRLDKLAGEKESLAAQIETMAQSEAQLMEGLLEQRRLTLKAYTPGATVKTLSATDLSTDARALIVFEATGTTVTLSAMDLPQLVHGQVYRVWLVKDDRLYDTGASFTVDATGYGQTDVELGAPLTEFDTMIITIGTEEGSPEPTGESVLKGDL